MTSIDPYTQGRIPYPPGKSAAASAFPGRAMLAPTDRFPLCSLLTDSQPIILQPPLQFRLVGYKNALLQG